MEKEKSEKENSQDSEGRPGTYQFRRYSRSQKGDLMLELKKSKGVTADKFLSLIEWFLRQKGDIRTNRDHYNMQGYR